MDTNDLVWIAWTCDVYQYALMTDDSKEQARLPGWIFLIPVTIIVAALTWFIVANAGR